MLTRMEGRRKNEVGICREELLFFAESWSLHRIEEVLPDHAPYKTGKLSQKPPNSGGMIQSLYDSRKGSTVPACSRSILGSNGRCPSPQPFRKQTTRLGILRSREGVEVVHTDYGVTWCYDVSLLTEVGFVLVTTVIRTGPEGG